jgi:hypothetical protein
MYVNANRTILTKASIDPIANLYISNSKWSFCRNLYADIIATNEIASVTILRSRGEIDSLSSAYDSKATINGPLNYMSIMSPKSMFYTARARSIYPGTDMN